MKWLVNFTSIFLVVKNQIALMDDQGEYILNGYNVITQYPRVFPYGGVTFEYTGTNSTLEKVNTTFARRLKRDLTVEVVLHVLFQHPTHLIESFVISKRFLIVFGSLDIDFITK